MPVAALVPPARPSPTHFLRSVNIRFLLTRSPPCLKAVQGGGFRSCRAPRGEPAVRLCRSVQQEPGRPGEPREAAGGLAQQVADSDGRAAHAQVGREPGPRVLQLLSHLRQPRVQSFNLLFPGAETLAEFGLPPQTGLLSGQGGLKLRSNGLQVTLGSGQVTLGSGQVTLRSVQLALVGIPDVVVADVKRYAKS